METIIKEFLQEHLYTHILLIALSVTGLLAAMTIDLTAGIRKARQRGEARTSKGLKKTADKATKYFLPYLVLVCADILCSIVIPIPIFSMVWVAYCIYCEFKSVREKAWEKAEIEKAAKTVSLIIENKDDIAKDIAAFAAKMIFDNTQDANKNTQSVHTATAGYNSRKRNISTHERKQTAKTGKSANDKAATVSQEQVESARQTAGLTD